MIIKVTVIQFLNKGGIWMIFNITEQAELYSSYRDIQTYVKTLSHTDFSSLDYHRRFPLTAGPQLDVLQT